MAIESTDVEVKVSALGALSVLPFFFLPFLAGFAAVVGAKVDGGVPLGRRSRQQALMILSRAVTVGLAIDEAT